MKAKRTEEGNAAEKFSPFSKLHLVRVGPSGQPSRIPWHRPSLYQDANQSVGMGGLPFESSTSCIRTVRGADHSPRRNDVVRDWRRSAELRLV